MALKSPLTELDINLSTEGFYKGFNHTVALASKIIIALIVIWAAIFPEQAGKILGDMKNWSFSHLILLLYLCSRIFHYSLYHHSPTPKMG